MSVALTTKPTLIDWGVLHFMIMDAPKDANLHLYLKECKKHNVQHITRIADPSYRIEEVQKAGIQLHEMHFSDGASPPEEIITQWCDLVHETFDGKKAGVTAGGDPPRIAVHCVAGLGRAPVLVAIALIEYGMDAVSAVTMIREKRRGAINAVQLSYLENYEPRGKKRGKCTIM